MKKRVSLVALVATLVGFVVFSGVVSAQANVQLLFFESPNCGVCKQMQPVIANIQAKNPSVSIIIYDITTDEGKNAAQANGVPDGAGTPVIIMLSGGSQVYYHETTFVDEATLQGLINQYAAKPTPTPTPISTPIPTPIPSQVSTPVPTPTPTATPAAPTVNPTVNPAALQATPPATPAIIVEQQQPQTVPEFSLLGLGLPALVAGAIYLYMRRS